MPLHHYLPATFLARFSTDMTSLPSRKRKIAVGNIKDMRVFRTNVDKVAAINNLYTYSVGLGDFGAIEKIWADFEGDLSNALELLISGQVNAKLWIRILVPFVASLLVRGPDFEIRFKRRIGTLGWKSVMDVIPDDNTNGARMLELQRLLGPVAVAKWTVVHVIGQEPLITNDLGYAPYKNLLTNENGIAIPLDPTHVLSIAPRTEGEILRVRSGKWVPIIDYYDNKPNNHEGLNVVLSSTAQSFIFGPEKTTIRKYLTSKNYIPFPPEPEQLGFITNPLAMAHEFTWHRLAAVIEKDIDDEQSWQFPLDWDLIQKGWTPIVFFPTNLIEFPSALKRVDDSIYAEFYDPQVYYSLSQVLELEKMGDFDSMLNAAENGLIVAKDKEHKVRLLVAKGSALDEKGEYDKAIHAYNEALALDPHSPYVLINKGVTLLKSDKIDEAMDKFNKAIFYGPEIPLARVNRGGALTMKGEYASAIDDLTIALESLPPGPARASAFFLRGKSLLGLRRNVEGIQDLDQAFIEYLDPSPKSDCLFQKAIAQRNLGDFHSALATVNLAIELEDTKPEFHLIKAELLLKGEELDSASDSINKCLSLDPTEGVAAQAHNSLAQIHLQQGDLQKALEENNKAISLDPKTPSLHYHRGQTLLFLGKLQDAIASFTEVIEIDNEFASAWSDRGIARAALQNYIGAISDLEKAVELNKPDHEYGSSLRNLVKCHLLIGDIEKAKFCLERAKAEFPNSSFNHVTEGIFLLYQGEFTDALTHLASPFDQEQFADIHIYLSIPKILLGETRDGAVLAKRYWKELRYPITKYEFMNHVQALRSHFPDKSELDLLVHMDA